MWPVLSVRGVLHWHELGRTVFLCFTGTKPAVSVFVRLLFYFVDAGRGTRPSIPCGCEPEVLSTQCSEKKIVIDDGFIGCV